jgi:beta-N-acetylhexosaminidase
MCGQTWRIRVGVAIVLACLCVWACDSDDDDDDNDDQSPADDDTAADDDTIDDDDDAPFCEVDEGIVADLVSRMTLREKVAQLYVVGVKVFPWFDTEETRALIEDVGVGGVYVQPLTGLGFWPEWTAQNMNRLQEMALSRALPVPLLVTIDNEGGIPQSLNHLTGGTDQPGNLGLGASFNVDNTHVSYGLMGEELAALGVNVSFAPVAELMVSHEETSMYTRCFGERSADVTAHTAQAVRGLQEQLVIASAKHFPSHSTAPGDEHFFLTVNEDDEQTVRDEYLPPFRAAMDAGVDMIMMTHSIYTAWDADMPSVFNRDMVTGLLRQELGYEGLIVTDDINMGAITLHEWDELPDVMALRAGVDMIVDCFANSESMFGVAEGNRRFPHQVKGQVDWVVKAVNDGRLSAARIDEAVSRVLRAKIKYCLFARPYVDVAAARQHVNTTAHIETSRRLHEDALTLVKNGDGVFPLDPSADERVYVVAPALAQWELYPDCAWGNIAGTDLVREVKAIKPDAEGETYFVAPLPLPIDRIVEAVTAFAPDRVILGSYNGLYYEPQRELIERIHELGIPTIWVALGMPYDLLAYPDAPTHLISYSNRDLAVEAVAQALFGLIEPRGRLPVSLPGLYDVGWSAADEAEDFAATTQ